MNTLAPPIVPGTDEAAYDAAFAAWLTATAAEWAAANPDAEPWPVERFDGCSGIPDSVRWACALHDCGYWFSRGPADRLAADRQLRDDIIGYGRECDSATLVRLWWIPYAWTVFTAVRAFGWLFAGKGRAS